MKISKKQALQKLDVIKKNFPMKVEKEKIKTAVNEFDNCLQKFRILKEEACIYQYDPIFDIFREKSKKIFMGQMTWSDRSDLTNCSRDIKSSENMMSLNVKYSAPKYYISEDADTDYFWVIPIIFNIKTTFSEDLPDDFNVSDFQFYAKNNQYDFYITIDMKKAIYLVNKSSNNFYIFDIHEKRDHSMYYDASVASTVLFNFENPSNYNTLKNLIEPISFFSSSNFLNSDFSYNFNGKTIGSSDIAFTMIEKLYSAINEIVIDNIDSFFCKVKYLDFESQIKEFIRQRIDFNKERSPEIKGIDGKTFCIENLVSTTQKGIKYFLLPDKNIFALAFCVCGNFENETIKDICIKFSGSCLFSNHGFKTYNSSGLLDNSLVGCGYFSNMTIMNTKEDFKNIILASNFASCGLFDFWDLDSDNISFLTINSDNYLLKLSYAPAIEQLTKILGYEQANTLIKKSYLYNINIKGKDFYSITGITNYCYRIGKKNGLEYKKIQELQNIINGVKNVNIEKCCKYVKKISPGMFTKILNFCNKNPGASYFYEITEYFIKCKREQRINESEILNIYRDYIEMASKLNLNLRDKSIRFPYSLIKEHDITVKNYNLIKQEFEKQKFQELRQSFLSYEYTEENGDSYRIIVPKTPEEIIMEGKNLHHCVASYVGRIIKGESIILFLRKNSAPGKSLYTIEVNPITKEVVQIRGQGNKLVSEKDIQIFFEKWKKSFTKTYLSA